MYILVPRWQLRGRAKQSHWGVNGSGRILGAAAYPSVLKYTSTMLPLRSISHTQSAVARGTRAWT